MLRKECWSRGEVEKGVLQEGIASVQERAKSLDQGNSSEHDDKWSDYGYFEGITKIC